MEIKTLVDLGLLLAVVLFFLYEQIRLKKYDIKLEKTLKRLDNTLDQIQHKHA